MSRVAIFVDAGYLFAQGSVALSGEKRNRPEIKLNEAAVLAELTAIAKSKCDGIRLLRTYWYDAAPSSGLTAQHTTLASTDYVKLRLGAINGQGQQKGVDSLIVTDMIELARNKSICDIVLVSGDEDVRIGVQIAQNYGVSVHLVGIHPARGSQSVSLRQEADTNTEWDKDTVSRFLTITAPVISRPEIQTPISPKKDNKPARSTPLDDAINAVVTELIESFDSDVLNDIRNYWDAGEAGLPSEVDRPLLGKLRDSIGRLLEKHELRQARRHCETELKRILAESAA